MSHKLISLLALVALVGCSHAAEPPLQIESEPGVRDGSDIVRPIAATASGEWAPAPDLRAYVRPVPLTLRHVEREDTGPYLSEGTAPAQGLLAFVNTASVGQLDTIIGASDQPVVGAIVTGRPFDTVSKLESLPGVDRPVLDGLLGTAISEGLVPGFDYVEVLHEIADLAEANNWDLSYSYGDRLRQVTNGEAERALGSVPAALMAQFAATNNVDGISLSTESFVIETYGVPVGWTIRVTTDDPEVARHGTHYFVGGGADHEVVVEADYVPQ